MTTESKEENRAWLKEEDIKNMTKVIRIQTGLYVNRVTTYPLLSESHAKTKTKRQKKNKDKGNQQLHRSKIGTCCAPLQPVDSRALV
ncbi:hypothetical protein RRG08_038108 [Elysia crispata]|uniref:Uncharacterized protein n=1 Tax=Elysia crispata TaxID=231223 RepID=A0AAE0ZZJ3_9GAST|nr:hypothetical protein RRG08_038108 [Elysia crispata]